MSTKVEIRLPIPEGRPGEVVTVSDHRADALIRNGYAKDLGTVISDSGSSAAVASPTTEAASSAPVVELPKSDERKEVWEKAAGKLGIDVEGKTKDEIMALVRDAVGG